MKKIKKIKLLLTIVIIMQLLLPAVSFAKIEIEPITDENLVTLTFRDKHLFNALKSTLSGKISSSSGPDSQGNYTIKMTQAKIDTVTTLDLQNKQISNISGIEKFRKLTLLKVNDNNIANINYIKDLSCLVNLWAYNNKISSINSTIWPDSLKYLYLSGNNISNINSVKWPKNLEKLSVGGGLTDISNVTWPSNLTFLNLGHNKITNIESLSKLTKLTKLYLNNNKITNIQSLSSLTNLTELQLQNNYIESISASDKLNKLTTLNIENQLIVKSVSDQSTGITLPQILRVAQVSGSKVYSSSGILINKGSLTSTMLNYSKSNLGFACANVLSGNAKGTILYVVNSDKKKDAIYNNEFKVYTRNDLIDIQTINNVAKIDLTGKTITMQNDINLENKAWTPIGNENLPFKGTFNGNRYKITGLNINTSEPNQGFIGRMNCSNAKIEYLTVEGTVKSTGSYTGGICGGVTAGTIINCKSNVNVAGGQFAGGITGYSYGMIDRCCNTGNVSGTSNVGGITGYTTNTIQNCYNTGNIKGTKQLGGITGNIDKNTAVVKNCYSIGEVTGSEKRGALVGINSGTVTNAYYLNTSKIKAINNTDNYTKNVKPVSADVMKTTDFLKLLNEGYLGGAWKAGNYHYEYPMLVWETYVTITGIEIKVPATKTEYVEGEDFDTEGMKVVAKYSDGTSKEITNYSVTGGKNLQQGTNKVTIVYEEGSNVKTADQSITVVQKQVKEITIVRAPTKTIYVEGENFDPTGMEVALNYNNGASESTTEYSIKNGENLQAGEQEIEIVYTSNGESITVKQQVTVVEKSLIEIKITQEPTKTTYMEGQDFDKSGMEVTAYYNNETSNVITEYTILNATNLIPDNKTVTISYTENEITMEATQEITVTHDFEETVTEPTCTEKGYTTFKCKICGYEIIDNETEALGHDYEETVTEPTCTEGGCTTHTCTRCNDTYIDNETEPLGHDYKETVTEPTCTEGGYTTHTCTRCNDTYVDNETKPLGHNYEDGVCTRCGSEAPKIEIHSEKYVIDEVHNYIQNIKPQTTVEEIIKNLTTNATEVKVYNKDGKELSNTDNVGTNTKIYLKNEYGEMTFTIIVTGDTDGNGEADFWDMILINKHRLGIKTLEEVEELAGDVTKDGKTDFWDMVSINNFRLHLKAL